MAGRSDRAGKPWPWPAPEDDGGAAHLLSGTAVPDVPLIATDGATVSFATWDRPAIVFVYPYMGAPGVPDPPGWDDIPGAHGSTAQAEGFARRHSDTTAAGFTVFGLSGQAIKAQRECAERLRLPYHLVNDTEAAFWKALKLPVFRAGGGIFLKRLTLVLRNGIIERVVYPVHPPDCHADDLLNALS